jgi:signal transduction histidine kinase
MGSAQAESRSPVPLESVLCTEELNRRPARPPDYQAIRGALVALAQTMADSPDRILQKLVETALSLCRAHSSGLSLLEEENGRKIFRWHGVAGRYAPYLWGTTPREFSPCGTVLDTDQVQLMSDLDRHFTYFAEVEPRISEALLVPFHVNGEAVGTIWVVSHDRGRLFDAEDARIITMLGEFAAAAYRALSGMIAMQSIVATIRDPLLVLDGALRVRMASRSFYETFQLTPGATEGLLLYQLENGQWDIPELRVLLDDILRKERVLENFEVRREFPRLGPRVMSLNARKLRREDNFTALILLAIEDVTARKQIEDELLRSNEDAQRFAYVAAHDLRAPLNSAVALLQLLDENIKAKLDEENRHVLSTATAGLQRLQALMSDILAYSQVGGAQERTIAPLQESLQMALSNLQKDIEETGAQLTHGSLPSLKADRSLMTLVFQNLIGNSLKFRANEPPRVQIEGIRENGEWIISVADNGQGFDSRYATQIFLPFKRLHGPETPGSGIGLATCKRVVERLGGRIWAEAAPGRGATFHFTLPDR